MTTFGRWEKSGDGILTTKNANDAKGRMMGDLWSFGMGSYCPEEATTKYAKMGERIVFKEESYRTIGACFEVCWIGLPNVGARHAVPTGLPRRLVTA